MFEKCIKCERLGESCVPNLMLLPFTELMQWCTKRQKHLEWTNQSLAERSNVPLGTINRIKAGEDDCKYSTIRSILITLIGGTRDEFHCNEKIEKELQHVDALERQAAKLSAVEKENEMLKLRIAECREQIDFLQEDIKAWRNVCQMEVQS